MMRNPGRPRILPCRQDRFRRFTWQFLVYEDICEVRQGRGTAVWAAVGLFCRGESMRNIYTVTQINTYIKNMFRQDFMLQSVLVKGEISNCTYHSSGHIYFTLKDAGGTLSCVMFRRYAAGLDFRLNKGDQVIIAGSVDVYEEQGKYQLYAHQIMQDGAGALNARYEALKKKLEEQGMFDEQYKKPIPKYIRTLGVVTAPTGAAVHDICTISLRRDPYLQIILYPAIVQGEEAPASIIRGIEMLDALHPDVIIIGRGGGSIEDLWAFNEEAVAEAVFNCSTPVISAVGHESDTVITDYVADLRASTPSAGAELAVFEYSRFLSDLRNYAGTLTDLMEGKTARLRRSLSDTERLLRRMSPASIVREQRMNLAHDTDLLRAAMDGKIKNARSTLSRYSEETLTALMEGRIAESKHQLSLAASMLDAASPLKKISGSYGYVTGPDGSGVPDPDSLQKGDLIRILMRKGVITAETVSVEKKEALHG